MKKETKKLINEILFCLILGGLLLALGCWTYAHTAKAFAAVKDQTTRLKCYSGERVLFYGFVRGGPEDLYLPQSRAWIFTDAKTGERHVLTGDCDAKEIK